MKRLKILISADSTSDDKGNLTLMTTSLMILKTRQVIRTEYTMIDVPLPGQKKSDKDEPPKRLNYNVEYFLSQIVTQVDFSYLNATYQPFTGAFFTHFSESGIQCFVQGWGYGSSRGLSDNRWGTIKP
ncbi:MAG: hypothetical protein R2764_03595 [Bacteroidales bacterium]